MQVANKAPTKDLQVVHKATIETQNSGKFMTNHRVMTEAKTSEGSYRGPGRAGPLDLHWASGEQQSNTDPKEDIGNQQEANSSDSYATEGIPKGNAEDRLYVTEGVPKGNAETQIDRLSDNRSKKHPLDLQEA